MSTKKKSTRSEWISCRTCDILVSSKDSAKHKSKCPGPAASVTAETTAYSRGSSGAGDGCDRVCGRPGIGNLRLGHGFIRSGVLYGDVCMQAEKANEKLPSTCTSILVHLNPDTMRLCNLCIGRPVLVTSCRSKVRLVGKAWPVANFPAASVGIDGGLQKVNGIVGSEFVCVEAVGGPLTVAKEMKLYSVNDGNFLQTTGFKQYFLRSMQGRCILPGSRLSISYYGKPVVSQVIEVKLSDGTLESINQAPYRTQPRLSNQSETRILDSTFADKKLSCDLSWTSESSFLNQGDPRTDCDLGELKRNVRNSVSGDFESLNQTGKAENKIDSGASNHESETIDLSGSSSFSTSTPKKDSRTQVLHDLSKSFLELDINESASIKSSQDDEVSPVISDLVFSTVDPNTSVIFVNELPDDAQDSSKDKSNSDRVTYNQIGGLFRQLKTIRETLELPLKNPEFFISLGVVPPRGVLMYGPPGVGKTMIARAVANEVGAHVTVINGPEIMSKYYGESEARLRSIFHEAAERAPSLIFIDELDALCPRREKVQSDLEKRIVATMLTLMDGVDTTATKGHLMVLGATNRPDAIDPALRRPGRFDREIEIGVPNAADRADILEKCLQKVPHTLTDSDIVTVADKAHGYVGADLAAVCKEAAVQSFERQKGTLTDAELKDTISVSVQDVLLALGSIKPSAMREVEIKVPQVHWSDIGGQDAIKQKLKQAVEWPIKHPEAFQRMGITPPRGILMYGPPGCSKTLIAKALATESGLNFIAVKGPELFNKWVGESERAVREVFRKARMAAPAIVFFDEIDALAVERGSSAGGSNVADRVLGQLLTEIDGVEKLQDVTIVAATNRPDMIDKALLRPGRLDRILYIPLPDWQTRREIFSIQFRNMPVAADVDLDLLVTRTDKYSGAEVVAVCREAGLAALQEDLNITNIHSRHFTQALHTVQPRTSDQLLKFYEAYKQNSGLHSI